MLYEALNWFVVAIFRTYVVQGELPVWLDSTVQIC